MPVFRFARDDDGNHPTPTPTPTATADSGDHPPNAGLIAGVVTCSAIVLFLIIVVVVPIIRRRRQRSPPPPSTVEQFLGKDSTFERQAPGDIAAILDHLSYLPQNGNAPAKAPTPKRRSLVLLGRRLSGQPLSGSNQRPSSIVYNPQPPSNRGQPPESGRNQQPRSGRNQQPRSGRNEQSQSAQAWDSYYEHDEKESQHSVPNMRDAPPEYAPSPNRSPFIVPASAPAAVSTSHNFSSTRPLQIRSRTSNHLPTSQRQPRRYDRASPDSESSDYSEESEDEYTRAHGSPNTHRPATGKENRQSTVGDRLKSRFSRDSYSGRPDSFALSAAPRPRNRAPPMSKSSGLSSPGPRASPRGPPSKLSITPMPLESLPEIPNSSIAVGFSLPDSPGDRVIITPAPEQITFENLPNSARAANPDSPDQYHHVPLTPRNVELPRTPRTPGSPLLREVLTPRTPYTPRTPRRDISSPRRDASSPGIC